MTMQGISTRKRFMVLDRDRYRCRYCGVRAEHAVLVMDHVVPKQRGGRDYASNLTAACEDCNGGKSDSMPSQELILAVKRAQARYEKAKVKREQCKRCTNLANFYLPAAGQQLCGICYRTFLDGMEKAQEMAES